MFIEPEAQAEQDYANVRRGQAAIRECMEAAGFEYVELDPDRDVFLQDAWYTGPNPEEFVDRYGYGISVGVAEEAFAGFADPNAEYLDSLDPALRDAWIQTFEGTDREPGCSAAGSELPQGNLDFQTRFEAAFQHQLDDMRTLIYQDHRVIDADVAWVECMAGHGFDEYTHPTDATTDITRRYEALRRASADESDERLGALQDEERRVATADLSCPNNNFGGWQNFLDEIYREYESEFFDQHETEILALLDGSAPEGS